jgi:bilirubin oxidase
MQQGEPKAVRTLPIRWTIAVLTGLLGCSPTTPSATTPQPVTPAPALHPGQHAPGHQVAVGEVVDLNFDPRYDGGARQRELAAAAAVVPLREPDVLFDANGADNIVEVNLVAEEAQVQLVPGLPTTVWVFRDGNFNGTGQLGPARFPGPIIQCREGDRVIVHFRNNLPPATAHLPEISNVHFHGMIIEPEQDGSPPNLVERGDLHTYDWVATIGFPMSGWYHAHPHGVTHIEVGRGMLSGIRVLPRAGLTKPHPEEFPPDERVTKADPLPAAFGDSYLFLTDFRLDENNQIGPDNEFDRINGREGNILTVNGQVFPTLTLRRGEVRRVRICDSSQARFYNLAIKADKVEKPTVEMIQVGTDGGLFRFPEPQQKILLSTAERAEVLLKAPNEDGDHTLVSLPFDRGQGLREDEPLPLMRIRVEGEPIAQPAIPGQLRFVPNLKELFGANALERTLRLALVSVGGGRNHFTIDGKIFDPLRIDNVVKFNTTEIWEIDNKQGNWAHPMHLHNIQFQVVEIDGKSEPGNNPKWKDTVNVPRSARARFINRFNDRRGMFMFHCHIIQHEDDGLMTTGYIEESAPPYQAPDDLPGGLGRPPEVIDD